jgi:hypothetical protein
MGAASTGATAGTGSAGASIPVAPEPVAIGVPTEVSAQAVLRHGLAVRLRSDRDGFVRVALTLVTRRAGSAVARAARRVRLVTEDKLVRAGRVRSFRLKVGARGRRALRRARRGSLVLQVRPRDPGTIASARRSIPLRG